MSWRTQHIRALLLCSIVLLLAACYAPASGQESPTVQPATSTPPAVASATAQPSATPIPPSPTTLPTATFAPSKTPPPIARVLYPPAGLATQNETEARLALYDAEGKEALKITLPERVGVLHIAGKWSPGTPSVPVIAYNDAQRALQLVSEGAASDLMKVNTLYSLVGAPGLPIVAFTALESQDAGLISRLYAGSAQELPTLAAALVVTSTESQAVQPLALHLNEGRLAGVWYTAVLYGIGGGPAPRFGLSYLDLDTGQSRAILPTEARFMAISPDQDWVAYVAQPKGALVVQSLLGPEEFTLPSLPDSQGVSEAAFTPDGKLVAWQEAHGKLAGDPPVYPVTVRVATSEGKLLADIPDTALRAAGGVAEGKPMWMRLVGWLDTRTLLAQGWSDRSSRAVYRVDASNGAVSRLGRGSFVGFLYP